MDLDYRDSLYIRLQSTKSSDYQGRLKETTQCGAELIGDGSISADAEILSMVVDSLKEAIECFEVYSDINSPYPLYLLIALISVLPPIYG